MRYTGPKHVSEDPMLSHKHLFSSVTIVPMLLHSFRDFEQTNRLTAVRGLARANCPNFLGAIGHKGPTGAWDLYACVQWQK